MKALITGASSGIGMDMARYLSNELGVDLILVARREERLKKLKNELKTDVEIICADLSDIKNVQKLYEQVRKKSVDILINNAGFGLFGEFHETDLDKELNMIDLNIRTVHYLTKMFLKDFIDKDSGYILNVASSAGFMAGPKLSTYYATKNYVLRLSQAIYEELKKKRRNVHISVLCPGPVDTEFNEVAKGEFHTKSVTSEYVAKYAIDKMFKNKLVIIPTLKMKLAIFMTRLVPMKLLLHITYNIQDRKIKKRG